jgi:xylulokinase
VVNLDLRPTKNEPKENSEEFSQVKAAAYQQGVDAIAMGCEGLFFLPYLTGERCPHPDPCARGAWIGITSRTTRDMLIRSVLEGVTFGMRDALEIMRDMNITTHEIRASGGGARSAFWRQLQADIYQHPVVITNAEEGPAYGAALLAGVGIGAWSSVEEACKTCIRQRKIVSNVAVCGFSIANLSSF